MRQAVPYRTDGSFTGINCKRKRSRRASEQGQNRLFLQAEEAKVNVAKAEDAELKYETGKQNALTA